MIKTTAMIIDELSEYSSPADKLHRLTLERVYTPIIKGLYETQPNTPGYLLAESIYGPSYLSFEFALSHHGMIPEAVYNFTSATYGKKKKKTYNTAFGVFTYRDIPSKVYPYGINIEVEDNRSYKIASAEKALCDQLYKMNLVSNYKELEELLFEDLRLDESCFQELNVDYIAFLCPKYGSTNVKRLYGFMRRF